ncbi:MAG: RagB/SusD family nutrient uptake outer membrane protein [Tannerellaceae bacterium]|jgi:hypothetical protein|nr:RagB/SusD family nutrient uptake outer membrane protein [Tannerellaceae bacterium]
MKQIYKSVISILFAAVALLPTTSCNDDLATNSSTDVSGDLLLTKTVGLNMLLRGAYNNLLFGEKTYGAQEAGTYVGIPGFNLYYDITGEDIMATKYYGMSPEDCYQFAPNRTNAAQTADKIWRMMYLIINQANLILDALPTAEGPQDEKTALEGQCKAFRGICYFHLIMNYQQTYAIAKQKRGVILRLSETQPLDLGFSSVEDCYKQIVTDLTEAKSLLANFKRTDKWQVNADVATGYLARVYQVMQNWQGALNEAESLYKKYGTLMTKEEWCGGHCNIEVAEIIWAVVNTNLSNNGDNTEFAYWHNQDPGYGEGMSDGPIYNFLSLFVDQKYVELFDDTDYRGTKCTKTWKEGDPMENHVTNDDEKGVMFWHRTGAQQAWRDKWAYNKFKYYGDDGLGGKGQRNFADYSILRSSEMLLIKAEAEANLGKAEAITSLNALQSARNANLTKAMEKSALLEAIYVERRKELLGEGVTGMYDLVRLQRTLTRHTETIANPAGHFLHGITNLDPTADPNVFIMPSNDYRYFCQIPINEFSNNKAVNEATDQNPSRGK